jgi:replicative DNA helicase
MGQPIDLVTLANHLLERKELEALGGAGYLASLAEMVPTYQNAEAYVRIVKEKALIRRTILASMEIAEKGFHYQGAADVFLDEAEDTLFNASSARVRPSFRSLGEVLEETINSIEAALTNKNAFVGISSGFIDLDRLTGGFQKQDLIIIAARPSMGKTAFCLNIARYAAMICKIPAALFSLEMSAEQVALRLLCSEARVESGQLRQGYATKEEMGRIIKAAQRLEKIPLYIDDSASLSALEVRAKARRMMGEYKLGIIIVDYLQLLKGVGNPENREKEISGISRSLKALAKELTLPVIALSQLNRAVENRTEKRPILADLRESGAIEQDADLIAFIYRDDVYNKNSQEKNVAEIIVSKHRNGPTGTVKLRFNPSFTLFEPLDTIHISPESSAF